MKPVVMLLPGNFYNDAIKASMEQYGVYSLATFTTYIALPDVLYNPAIGHEQIITQKWVHMYLNSWETWSDWRRTGFPVLTPAQDAIDPRGIPIRLGYPTTEPGLNETNYEAAVSSMGGTDDNYAKMWWKP